MRAKWFCGIGAFIVCVILCGSAFGQADTTSPAKAAKEFPRGKWGLQIRTANPFINSSRSSIDLAPKYFLGPQKILRLSVTLSGTYSHGDEDGFSYQFSDSGLVQDSSLYDVSGNGNTESIGLSLHFINYIRSIRRIDFYWGMGPVVSYAHNKSKSEGEIIYDSEPRIDKTIYRSNRYTAGFSGLIGMEYFPFRRLSISAEYAVSALYEKSKTTEEGHTGGGRFQSERHSDRNQIYLRSSDIDFGVTVYF